MSISSEPDVLSTWALIVPSPKGTSVMTWFMRMLFGTPSSSSSNSSRILRAAATHSSERKGYWSIGCTVAVPNSLTDHMAGVLLLHGYTSTPQSVEGLAAALVGAGFDVDV